MKDPWCVAFGNYHFGPFKGEAGAKEFCEANDIPLRHIWPLWAPDEHDVIEGGPILNSAKKQALQRATA